MNEKSLFNKQSIVCNFPLVFFVNWALTREAFNVENKCITGFYAQLLSLCTRAQNLQRTIFRFYIMI